MAAMFIAKFEFEAGPPDGRYTASDTFTFFSADAKSAKKADVRACMTKAKAKARKMAPRKFKRWGLKASEYKLRYVECVG